MLERMWRKGNPPTLLWCQWWRTTCQCRRRKRHGFHPWVRKIPWRRKWQPTPVFLPGEPHGQRSLAGYSPWGCKELDTTEATELACTHLHCWWECKLVQPLWRIVWRLLKKLKLELPCDPAIPLQGTYLKKAVIQRYMHSSVHSSTTHNSELWHQNNLNVHWQMNK